jgi:predicted nucleic acid-binding protein
VSTCVVCDASALTALLLDSGPEGRWVTEAVTRAELAAPSLIGFETANIVRRHELEGLISPDQAAQAHADLLDLAIEHWPHEILAARAWQLRLNLTIYDASYVALAELLDATLITLDRRLGRAPGPRCAIATP